MMAIISRNMRFNSRKIAEKLAEIVPSRIGFLNVVFFFIVIFIIGLFDRKKNDE